jgi:hypothetical protein
MADFLTLADLTKKCGAAKLAQYLNDDGNDAEILATNVNLIDVMDMAEAEGYSRMLRHYPTRAAITLYANEDAAYRGHCAWIAVQFASERRPSFTSDEGEGAWKTQYDRAIKYLNNVSKGLQRGTGEAGTTTDPGPGQGANTGGIIQPRPPAATGSAFTFAPGKESPTGHGGFMWPLLLALPHVLDAVAGIV